MMTPTASMTTATTARSCRWGARTGPTRADHDEQQEMIVMSACEICMSVTVVTAAVGGRGACAGSAVQAAGPTGVGATTVMIEAATAR